MNLAIVARYNERPFTLPWKQFVVRKGVDMPNEGREAGSFFWWMAHEHISKTGMYAFLQGDPTAHGEINLRHVDSFTPLGSWRVRCDLYGSPHHHGLPIVEYWERWIGGTPPETLDFTAGGQFLVPGKVLLRRSKEEYERMLDDMCQLEDAPWVMERLWPYYFANP